MAPIAGRITLDGGPWKKAGVILFHPVDAPAGQSKIPGSADFSPDGAFAVLTFKAGDGLVPGRYKVTADCWEEWPHDGLPGKNCYVPQLYRSPKTTPLELTVAPGVKQKDVRFDVVSAKKQ